MMTRLKIILSVAVTLIFVKSHAQQVGLRITSSAVSIYNNSRNETSILLGDTTIRLDTFRLKPGEVWYSPAYASDPVIKIQTKNHITTYLLKRGDSFMIYWNKKRKYWDVKKIKPRQDG